jgi:DNA-binding transcriptional LysR family regulator
MSSTIDLSLLQSFVRVAETQSFSRAAAALGVTTGTVSRNLARLEQAVGAELLHRTTRRVALSTAGEALFARSAPHVRALDGALRELPEREPEPAGTLRITAPHVLGVTLLADVVARYVALHPKVRVEADFTNRNVDLVAERFDLALRGDSGLRRDSTLTIRKLATTSLRFFATPAYLERRGTPRVAFAAEHDWVMFGPLPKELKIAAAGAPRIVGNDVLFLREATLADAGVGLLPPFVADPLVARGLLRPVLPRFSASLGGLVLLYPSAGPLARKVAAFRDLVIDSLGSQLKSGAPTRSRSTATTRERAQRQR